MKASWEVTELSVTQSSLKNRSRLPVSVTAWKEWPDGSAPQEAATQLILFKDTALCGSTILPCGARGGLLNGPLVVLGENCDFL